MIRFGGVSSDSLNLEIERVPDYKKPERKYKKYDIPGRNGELILMQDAWKNVTQRYKIFSSGRVNSVPLDYEEIAAWLYQDGYQRLEDDFDPDHYRLAYFPGPFDIENIVRRAGSAQIEFNCRPERFLISGELEQILTPDYTTPSRYIRLANPTSFPAKPLIRVVCEGADEDTECFIWLSTTSTSAWDNRQKFYIFFRPELENTTFYIDTQSLDCYDESGNNLNRYIRFAVGTQVTTTTHGFPELAAGATYIGAFYADDSYPNTMITEVGITPNWWRL